jgi:hypothetical protein
MTPAILELATLAETITTQALQATGYSFASRPRAPIRAVAKVWNIDRKR